MEKSIERVRLLILTVVLVIAISTITTVVKADTTITDKIGVQYQAHVQDIGWQNWVDDGALAGTEGKALRVEAFRIKLENVPAGLKIKYKTHVQNIGWQNWKYDGELSGTEGQALRVEALQIMLEGTDADKYSVQYQAHVENEGWQQWVEDGQVSGSFGKSQRIEALIIKIVEKIPSVSYQGHVQNIGWQNWVADGALAGTEGKALRVEAFRIKLGNAPAGLKIKYKTHVQNIGWQDWIYDGGLSGTEGQALRVEALQIMLEGTDADKYSVQYQAHVENEGWQQWVEDGQVSGSFGKSQRIEAIRIRIVSNIVHPTSLSINKTIDNLTVGDTDTLVATVAPANATNQAVTWTSSDNTIAIVDNTGKVTAIGAGTTTITATTVDGSRTANCSVIVNNKKGYVYNPNFQIDLNVRSSPSLKGSIIGELYNFEKIEILDTICDSENNLWNKIIYNNSFAYVSDAYIQHYTSPPDSVVNIAVNITKQFEVGTSDQIAGNFDGQGLSLGYLQWCIGQGTLQSLLNRMDRQYNSEMKSTFGENYDTMHSMILDTQANQLTWAQSINDSTNKIISPWYSQFVSLSNNQNFINVEKDAEVYTVKQAMIICDKYNLKTVRGFALAFDIVNQNGSISLDAAKIIDSEMQQNPNMTEKDLITVIANAVADSSNNNSEDIRSRKIAIVNGQGYVHGYMLNLDANYGLSDNNWR